MKNKIVKISICILLVIIIGGALYYCIVYDKTESFGISKSLV